MNSLRIVEHLAVPLVNRLVADDFRFQLLNRPSHEVTSRLSGTWIVVSDVLNTRRESIFGYLAFMDVLNTSRGRVFVRN